MVEFGVLGPLEIRGPSGAQQTGGGKQQLLLALLVLHPGEFVSRTSIIDALWPEHPPPSAQQSVDSYVSRLRSALRAVGGDGGLIVSGPGGYRLAIDACTVDAAEFLELANGARAALAADEPLTARELADRGLALWRGAALDGLAHQHAIRPYAADLEERRVQALETRAEADLELGRHVEAVPELRSAASRYPTRERLCALLMIALYRADRQAEALDVFAAARAHLTDELGLEPGVALRELQAKILRHDESLAPPPSELPSTQPELEREPGSGRHSRRWPIALGGAVAAAMITVIGVLATSGGAAASFARALRVPALGVLDPRTGQPMAALTLAAPPSRITTGIGAEWATSYDDGTLMRIDPAKSAVVQTVQVGHGATGVAVAGGDVWVADTLDNRVARVDARTNQVVQKVPVGASPADVAAGAGSVWVANTADGTVTRIDPLTGGVLGTERVGPSPRGVVVGAGGVWVALAGAGAVARLDPHTGKLVQTIEVGSGPSAVAVGPDGVWVANAFDSTVSLIRPSTDTVVLTRAVSGSPASLAAVGGGVWVAGGGTVLTRLASSGEVRIHSLPSPATALSTGRGRLVVGVAGIGASHRGGTLVVQIAQPIGSIDPAACCDIPPDVRMLSYDGLLSYSKSPASPDTLVPDLALSIPAARENGLSYTFRLRPGLRYWDGTPVRASDFRRGLERAAQSSSIDAAYLGALAGALRCPAASRCDLSAAVTTNDSAGTLTLHLSHSDPDLLDALGLPYFAPAPAVQGTRPGTGPYRIARFAPGKLIDLVRNRYFHSWAPAAQPAGYPDRIVVQTDGSSSADIAAVLNGTGDYTFDQPTPGQLARIQVRSPDLLHTEPLPDTDWLDLNTRATPFNDVRVRRALNYAVDRNAIAKLYGGRDVAAPTCQIIPVTIPGHVPYCPYSKPRTSDGRWIGPDLRRARRLVAASGTRGEQVRVLTRTLSGPSGEPVARYVLGLLRTLGYRAQLQAVPPSRWDAAIDDYRHPPQINTDAWIADYPSPAQWISLLLGCSKWRPPAALTNHAEFCDRAVDRLAAAAAREQITDPTSASRLWAQADRAIASRAPWVPTVTETETDLVSRRVGNYQYVPTIGALLDELWVR